MSPLGRGRALGNAVAGFHLGMKSGYPLRAPRADEARSWLRGPPLATAWGARR